jgi:hypothetical protein
MQDADYSEWVPMGILVKGLVAIFLGVLTLNTFLVFFFGGFSVDNIYGVLIGWGITGFVLFLIWNYRGLSIRGSCGKLTVVYGLFNKKSFFLEDLTYCRRTKANFGRYWGIGVRCGTDGSVAYTTSLGDAVEVALKDGEVFVFSSKKPDQVIENINKLKVN